MKIRFLLLALAGVGMLASCSKETANEGASTADGSKSIVLKINLPQGTRAFTPDDPYVEDGTTISSIDVYFTNANAAIQYAYRLENEDLTNIQASSGLRFTQLDNVSRVYCVANMTSDLLAVGQRMDLNFETLLRNQGPAADQNTMIFAGSDIDITPIALDTNVPEVPNYSGASSDAPGATDQVYTAVLTIRPLISRLEWGDVTIQHNGNKVVEDPNTHTKYWIEWRNWNPTLVGVYQSNVYLSEQIFAATGSQVTANTFFERPTATGSIVNGAWAKPTTPAVGDDVWKQINAILAYSGYSDEGTPGALIADLDAYNAGNYCIPFHFFVPFTASLQTDPSPNQQTLAETPEWHFQFYYPDVTNGGGADAFTVEAYAYDEASGNKTGDPIDLDSNDAVLSLVSDFYYPTRADGLAYANVTTLYDASASVGTQQALVYRPGKIYTTDVSIAPYNVTAGFRQVDNYNIIVKVTVADFEKQAVTPEFDKE